MKTGKQKRCFAKKNKVSSKAAGLSWCQSDVSSYLEPLSASLFLRVTPGAHGLVEEGLLGDGRVAHVLRGHRVLLGQVEGVAVVQEAVVGGAGGEDEGGLGDVGVDDGVG